MIIEFLIWLVIFQSAQNVYVCSGVLFTKIKFLIIFYIYSLIFLSSMQNLRVKYYKEGEWISEKNLAEGLW